MDGTQLSFLIELVPKPPTAPTVWDKLAAGVKANELPPITRADVGAGENEPTKDGDVNLEQLAKLGCNALIDLMSEIQQNEGPQDEIALNFTRDRHDYKIIVATGPALPLRDIDVSQLSDALDNAIEQITAQLVHGEVTNEGWQITLDELVAAQQKHEG